MVNITNITELEKKMSEDFFKHGYKSWDELIVVIPGKMDDNESLESHEKKEQKIKDLITKYGDKSYLKNIIKNNK
jgi:hypothetical protein